MATHSSVLAWRIPGTGEPGGLLSMGSHRVGHDWSDLAAALWDSKCLYCSKNGKGWISKNEFVKCNNQVDVLSLSPSLSPPPSLKFRIILPIWDQHNDFIWESTLPPCSVQVTHVKLNSPSPLPGWVCDPGFTGQRIFLISVISSWEANDSSRANKKSILRVWGNFWEKGISLWELLRPLNVSLGLPAVILPPNGEHAWEWN